MAREDPRVIRKHSNLDGQGDADTVRTRNQSKLWAVTILTLGGPLHYDVNPEKQTPLLAAFLFDWEAVREPRSPSSVISPKKR